MSNYTTENLVPVLNPENGVPAIRISGSPRSKESTTASARTAFRTGCGRSSRWRRDCSNPINDPTGYAAYISAFGDWHPAANSFLIGKGTADSNVTTDADGVTRPNPPTIGAYEPRLV